MKYLVVSDIHGSLPRLEKVLHFFEAENYDMLLILGDILNYGPRNGLPEGINAPGIVERLNAMAHKVVAVRGNCDSEVDQMLLEFPCMADYAMLVVGTKRIFLTHGHKYNEQKRTPQGIDVIMYGHTHLWQLEQISDGLVVCNTGSITFPKGGNLPTFATIEEDLTINIRDLDGNILKNFSI
ncbi:MAG: phosphodiesterase [Bacteroidales bacterium]|nr:phosphodiesterase [Bacteroidales bacterium]